MDHPLPSSQKVLFVFSWKSVAEIAVVSLCRDAPTSSSDGEEKKPAASSSASGHMPEMSADSKLMPL